MKKQINIQNYLYLADEDWDFLYKLLHQSILGLKELKNNYQVAVATRNIEQLHDAIHKIKPTLVILEAHPLLAHLETSKQMFSEANLSMEKILNQAALVSQTIEEVVNILNGYMKTNHSVE